MILRPSPNTSRHASPDPLEKSRVEKSRVEKSRVDHNTSPLNPPKGGRTRTRKNQFDRYRNLID
jgi:hypothetical protein